MTDQKRSDLRALHERQRGAVLSKPRWTARERRARLRALARAVNGHRRALRAAMAADFGKPADEVDATELIPTLAEIRHAERNLERWMRPIRVATPLTLFAARSEVRREPKGHVLIISPWNYPIFLTLPPLAAAIAAGNRAIVRPSEKAPHTAQAMARIVADVFPADEVALVEGEADVAEFLLTLPFDHFFFTGSARVGKLVMHAAADQLAGITLELGGKSPAIVDEHANLARAADRIVWGKFINAGQTCVAPDYVLVAERCADAFTAHLRRSLARTFSHHRSRATSHSRIIDDAAFERLIGALDHAVAAGARVETGGARDRTERTIAPTVLSDVAETSPIMEAEIFGPILPVLRYRRLEDAVRFVNGRPKPLALYLFTKRRAVVDFVLSRTSAGGSVVNDTVLHLANPCLPFGGAGESGIGNYHGEFGFRTFSHERAVLRRGRFGVTNLLYPPYGLRTRAVTAFVRRFLT